MYSVIFRLGRELDLLQLGELRNIDGEPTLSGSIRTTRLSGAIESKRDGEAACKLGINRKR